MAQQVSEIPAGGGATPALIRWGAVFAGVVLGLSTLILLSSLWAALGFGTEMEGVQQNLGWILAASTVVALFVGGLLAGWLSGVPGFAPGFFNGLCVWGLTLVAVVAIGLPGVLQTFAIDVEQMAAPAMPVQQALWSGFVSLLVGLLAAGLGGGLGGSMTRPAFIVTTAATTRADAPVRGRRRADPSAPPPAERGPAPAEQRADERTVRLPEDEPAARRPEGD